MNRFRGKLPDLQHGSEAPYLNPEEASISLRVDLLAYDNTDTLKPQILTLPHHTESVGYRLQVTSVGDHTNVEVTFVVPKRGSLTAGILFGDILLEDIENDLRTANPDWIVSVEDASPSYVFTFDRASLGPGVHTIDLLTSSVTSTTDWMRWGVGLFSNFNTDTVYNGPCSVTATCRSDQVSIGINYSETNLFVGEIYPAIDATPNPVDVNDPVSFTITVRSYGHEPTGNSILLQLSSADANTSQPTVTSNPDGWTIGAWSSPGGNVLWEATATRASLPDDGDGPSSITFETIPSASGNLSISAVVSSSSTGFSRTNSIDVTVENTWTVDPASGKSFPANATEWDTFISANSLGISTPDHLYLCQEASGNLADSIGSDPLTAVGTILYQQAATGYTRLAVQPSGAGSNYFLSSTYNPNTTSQFCLIVCEHVSTTNRYFAQYGSNASLGVRLWFNGTAFNTISSSGIDGSTSNTGMRPWFFSYNRGTSDILGGSDHQILSPPSDNFAANAAATYIGGISGGASSAPKIVYIARWVGAAAEAITQDKIEALLTAMGFTTSWWTKDATSGKSLPSNQLEWKSFHSYWGIDTSKLPSHLWNCQDAASPLVDVIGGVNLSAGGTLTGAIYQNPVSGWSRTGTYIAGTGGSWGANGILDPSTTSCAMLVLAYVSGGSISATRCLFNLTDGLDPGKVQVMYSEFNLVAHCDGVGTSTPATMRGFVRPVLLVYDRTNGRCVVYTDETKVATTYSAAAIAGRTCLGRGIWSTWNCDYLYAVAWEGAAAEMTDTDAWWLLRSMGWTPSWSP